MNNMQLFENQPVRMAWDEEREEWYFSIVDVVKVLTEQQSTRGASDYWHVLKNRLKKEGVNELLTNCKQFRPYTNRILAFSKIRFVYGLSR